MQSEHTPAPASTGAAIAPAIIACDVFLDELALLLPADKLAGVQWLEMGLHDHPDRLRASVAELIERIERQQPHTDTILLVYGLCGNGLAGLKAGRCRLVIPRAHDCISILLGSPEKHAAVLKQNPGTYFYSPGWIRGKRVPGPDRHAYLKELYSERYPDDAEMVDELIEMDDEAFAHHSCAAYVDITGNTGARSYCQQCALHQGWEFKPLAGDPAFLRELLQGPWAQPRFAVADSGQVLKVDREGLLSGCAEL